MSRTISDSVFVGNPLRAYNGAVVDAWLASRTWPGGLPPAEGAAPPAGAADAGPVTTSPAFGNEGSFDITVPDADVYLRAVVGTGVGWKLYPATDVAGVVTSVTAADATIVIAGTAAAPTVAVGTVPYADLSGAPALLAAADSTIVVGGTLLAPTVAVGTVPYADLSGAPVILAAADSTITVGGTLLAPTVKVGTITGAAITFPLTNAGDMGFRPDGIASNALIIQNAASAVTGITIAGQASGTPPTIGNNSTVGVNVLTGTGPLQINGAAGSSSNVLTSNGAGAAPTWSAAPGVSWPLTNSGDEAFQPNSVANSVLTLHNNASASTGLTITGTNAAGLILSSGADLDLQPTNVANNALVVKNRATSDCGVVITAGLSATADPQIGTTGSGPRGLTLTSQAGTVTMFGALGNMTFDVTAHTVIMRNNNGSPIALCPGGATTAATASLVVTGAAATANQITITGVISPNTPTATATGSDTNIALGLAGKGTGSVTLNTTFAIDSAGHIISTSAGTPATSNLGANVTSATFTGNDVRGTIAIVMGGSLAANTRVCTATFATTYGATSPKVTLVDQTSTVGLTIVNSYVLAQSTGVSFDIAFDQALAAGTYVIDYIVIG